MKRKYSSPRYKRSTRTGRKPLPKDKRRKTVSVRVAPETYKYLFQKGLKAGREIDRLVKKHLQASSQNSSTEIALIDSPDANLEPDLIDTKLKDDILKNNSDNFGSDTIMEMARGLLALVAERGTEHLSQEQISLLDDNFTLIINNYLATFRHKKL